MNNKEIVEEMCYISELINSHILSVSDRILFMKRFSYLKEQYVLNNYNCIHGKNINKLGN